MTHLPSCEWGSARSAGAERGRTLVLDKVAHARTAPNSELHNVAYDLRFRGLGECDKPLSEAQRA